MAELRFSAPAVAAVKLLPKDAQLLKGLFRQLEWIAEDVQERTVFPPPFPHRQDRRFAEFRVNATGDVEWSFGVTMTQQGEIVTIQRIQAATTF